MAAQRQTFEESWPALSGRLRRVLVRRHVPYECVDDVVQETGLRLLRTWPQVEHSTLWSFTLTIAGNIIKDDMRRRVRDERYAESLTSDTYVDIEERALARVELARTERAIRALSAAQRVALLSEVFGFENTMSLSAGAVKMSRMRARRRLRAALDRASGLVALSALRLRRSVFGDPRNNMFEAASQTVAAALLIVGGMHAVMLGGGVFARNAAPGSVAEIAHPRIAGSVTDASKMDAVPVSTGVRYAAPVASQEGESEELLGHGRNVGPNGANGWLRGALLGQKAHATVEANRESESCEGSSGAARGNNGLVPCAGTVTVRATVEHNGKTYGASVSSTGETVVERPRVRTPR